MSGSFVKAGLVTDKVILSEVKKEGTMDQRPVSGCVFAKYVILVTFAKCIIQVTFATLKDKRIALKSL